MIATPPSKCLKKANWGEEETMCLVQMYQQAVCALKPNFKMPWDIKQGKVPNLGEQ